MLPKLNRIKLNDEKYRKLRQTGINFNTKLLKIVVAAGKKERSTRFAFIVSKKLDKRATKRKRTHRLLANAVHKLLPRVKNGYEVMIIAKTIFCEEKTINVLPIVEEALKRAGLLIRE